MLTQLDPSTVSEVPSEDKPEAVVASSIDGREPVVMAAETHMEKAEVDTSNIAPEMTSRPLLNSTASEVSCDVLQVWRTVLKFFHSFQVSTSTGKEWRDMEKSDHRPRDKDKGRGKRIKKERKEKTRKREERIIDDTQSEVSFGQPDTDLSKSKTSKKAFSC